MRSRRLVAMTSKRRSRPASSVSGSPSRSGLQPASRSRNAPSAGQKIHKLLAETGRYSRREAEALVIAGRVRVGGRRAAVGQRLLGSERVTVDGAAVPLSGAAAPNPTVLLYHKPVGEICSRHDPQRRPTVFAALPSLSGRRWIGVGRLDFLTSGLLLFTDDGMLANRLMHPATGVEREYVVRVRGAVDEAMLQRLLRGVPLDEQLARFSDVQPGGASGSNRWFYVVLTEGRNRAVRRLWESQGVQVSRLKRVRFANLLLPAALPPGRSRLLSAAEVRSLLEYCDRCSDSQRQRQF